MNHRPILITGAGLIGCLTARILVERGDRVILLDRFLQHDAIASVVSSPMVTLVQADVTDYVALEAMARQHKVTAVIHTAALLSTAIRKSPMDGVRVNVLGCAHVLELARTLALERVVIASSATVAYPSFAAYDAQRDGPGIPENFTQQFLSHRPTSIYQATKCFDEYLALLYRDLYQVSSVCLRYAAVIGAWIGTESSVPGRLLSTLLGAGRRNVIATIDDPLLSWQGGEEFVDARDCAAANVAALDTANPAQGIYNIGSGQSSSFEDVLVSVRGLYPTLKVQMNCDVHGGFAGFPHLRPAPSALDAAERELSWHSQYTLNDSVRHFAPWFRS